LLKKILLFQILFRYSIQTKQMSKKRKAPSKITPNDLLTISKRIQREEMISQGAQVLRASRVHTSKKDYSRKLKHKAKQY